MEKLIITAEQKEALKFFNVHTNQHGLEPISTFVKESKSWNNIFAPLKDFTVHDLLKLLCGWYEVEEFFKEGDWVFNKKNQRYYKVVNKRKSEFCNHNEVSIDFTKEYDWYKKIEEPWKIMLLELGRAKPELKEGDKYVRKDDYHFVITLNKQDIPDSFLDGRLKYFYPVESRIEL